MKKGLIALMSFQVLLFCIGILQLTEGKLFFGLFNVIVNAVFVVFNIRTLTGLSVFNYKTKKK